MDGVIHTLAELILSQGRRQNLSAGQTLYREGDPSTAVYAVRYGRVKVFLTTPAGRDVVLGVRIPTQVFGELSAIDGRPRSASVKAIEATTVAELSGEEFVDALRRFPELAAIMVRELSIQLRECNARLAARDTECTSVRVGHLLLDLAAKFTRHGGPDGERTPPTSLPFTQEELASWVGATREATARALAAFRRAGVIETARHRVVVLDVGALAAMTDRLAAATERADHEPWPVVARESQPALARESQPACAR